ncbi:Ig-like domain repeat protein [Dactylosporangium sp. NPDC000244]|uniref:Ig-like domain repeat protein n=1 Tax=Dactylosporangium sp. NPDC000244 TaxID=3154365 RepID=UPI00331D271B
MGRVSIGAALAAIVSVAALTAGATPALAQPGAVVVNVTPNPSVRGQAVKVCAEVSLTEATGTVTFSGAGASGTVALNQSGEACITSTDLESGTVTAAYSGDAAYDPESGTAAVTIEPASTTTVVTATPDPSVSGQSVQLCATVTADQLPEDTGPTGTVTFTYPGGSQSATLSAGEACVTDSDLTTGTVEATYDGDGDFAGSSGTTTVTRDQADTTTAVTATPDPSVAGQSVDVCATVQALPPGTGVPTGTLTFTAAGGFNQTVTLNGAGKGCTTTTALTGGTITATYDGDADFSGSTDTFPATVDPATTTTTVSATPDPSTAGQSVQVCATVAVEAPASGTPTGTVTFTGAGLTDTVPLSAGEACTTSTSLATGTINAAYNGAADFAVSSGTTSVTVNDSNPSPSPPSRPRNVTATASASSVTVNWDAPATGADVTGYTVTASPGPQTCTTTGAKTCVLGAVAGTTYTYTVVAHSEAGDSAPSEPSTAVTPAAPTAPDTPPSTNLTLTTTDGNIATAEPGQRIVFVGTGFAPHSTVLVTIYSTPIELGRVTTDATGAFQTPITLPQQLAAAQHTVVAQGAAPDGSPRSMALTVTVATAPVVTSPVTTGGGGTLPVTGPPFGLLLLTGLALALTGAALLKAGRRAY